MTAAVPKHQRGVCLAFDMVPTVLPDSNTGEAVDLVIVSAVITADAFDVVPLHFRYEGEHAQRAFVVHICEQAARLLDAFQLSPAAVATLRTLATKAAEIPVYDEKH
jgi:hypothetical protein